MDENVSPGSHLHVHEGSDVHARPLILFFVAFSIFTATAFVVVKWSYHALVKYENAQQGDVPTRVAAPKTEIPESLRVTSGAPQVTTLPQNAPMLQPDPVKDMQVMRAEQEAKLTSYGWIDREKGLVRVPIERAMAFTLERSMVKAQAAEPSAPVSAPAPPATVAPAKGATPTTPAPATH